MAIPRDLDRRVRRRAGGLCEYCRLPLAFDPWPFHVDHKLTREITRLYNPRRDRWEEHFRCRGPQLVGLTAIGRVTIRVLAINHPDAVKLRRELIAEGVFPPST